MKAKSMNDLVEQFYNILTTYQPNWQPVFAAFRNAIAARGWSVQQVLETRNQSERNIKR